MSLKDPNIVDPKNRKKVAIVLSNPAVSSTTGWPVGFWWSELAHPYFILTEKGYQIELFSPDGGKCEADALSDPRDRSGYSSNDLIRMGFLSTPTLAALIENTKKVIEIDVNKFDAIICAGGQGPMFTYGKSPDLQKKFVQFYDVEEDFADNAVWSTNLLARDKRVTPWRIEDELKKLGANYIQAGLWRGFAIRDGNLITGQQNFSGGETAEAVATALGE